jgi:hypothetical protein
VRDQVQRMIEGRDRDHRADRLGLGEGDPVRAGRVEPHRDHLAGLGAQRLDADLERVGGARDLHPRIDERLAAFPRREGREALGALAQERLGALEDLDAAGGRQPGRAVAEQRVRGGERVLDDRGVGGHGLADHAAIVRGVHGEGRGAGGRLAHLQRYSPELGGTGTLQARSTQ